MHGESRLRLQVGALFAVIAVAFIGVNLTVMLAVWPQVRRLEHLHVNLAQCQHLLAQMRGAAQDLRFAAMSSVLAASRGRPGAAEEASTEIAKNLGLLSRLGAAYDPLVEAADEAETWSAIRDGELPSLAARSAVIVENARGPGGASPAAIEALRSQSRRVDGLFQQLVHINTSQVQRSAEGIDTALRRLIVLCGLLLVVGGAGAALLLARSLSLIRSYTTVMDARLSELDAFASRVAHDLRSPLQTISLALSSIAKRVADEGVRLVDAHSGTVRVESEEGVGTVFIVELPRAIDVATREAAGRSDP